MNEKGFDWPGEELPTGQDGLVFPPPNRTVWPKITKEKSWAILSGKKRNWAILSGYPLVTMYTVEAKLRKRDFIGRGVGAASRSRCPDLSSTEMGRMTQVYKGKSWAILFG